MPANHLKKAKKVSKSLQTILWIEEGSHLFNLEDGKELFCLNREFDPIINRYYESLDQVFETLINIRRSITPYFSGDIGFE